MAQIFVCTSNKESAVAGKLPSHLKIHVEEQAAAEPHSPAVFDAAEIHAAFTEATGWIPQTIRSTPHMGKSDRLDNEGADGIAAGRKAPLRSRVRLISFDPIDGVLDYDAESLMSASNVVSEEAAWRLYEQIDALSEQLVSLETALQTKEAELATSVAVSIRPDEAEVLSTRLEETLQRSTEQTGSDAAALYLLNDSTSQLEMRSCFGMPASRLAQPARELRGSMADLEALMGNAVLLENTSMAAEWNCPEQYAAAICLPIGSPTMPHGTLWLFSDHVRDFSSTDIEIAKAATEKILADIERSVLSEEVLRGREMDRGVEEAGLTQSTRLPDSQPLHADYDLSGWTFQGQAVGGNFHTWTLNRQQKICAAIGEARPNGMGGALVAASLQTIIETCWNAKHRSDQILRRANDQLWNVHDSDWRSSLAYMLIDPDSGQLDLSMAGCIQGFLFGQNGYRMLTGTGTELAAQPDTLFQRQELTMEAGELLVFASSAVIGPADGCGITQDELLREINELYDEPVSEIADHLARKLPLSTPTHPVSSDRSLLILRRRF
ncbi:MAG TPA: hypothetical protein DDW52_30020 [Planctomycetaceae bacterium]|nr:hypothetical protein [Planctomycetaceae bacterium]